MIRRVQFTLLELLTVMMVAAILAGIILVAASGVTGKSKRAAVRSELQQIQMALEKYKDDWGYYPQTGGEAIALKKGFIYGTSSGAGLQKPNHTSGVYGQDYGHYYLDVEDLKYKSLRSLIWWEEDDDNAGCCEQYYPDQTYVTTSFFVDRWDKPYWYQAPGAINKESYDLWSTGPDKMHGDADKDEGGISGNPGRTYPIKKFGGPTDPAFGITPAEDADPGDHVTSEPNDDITNWKQK